MNVRAVFGTAAATVLALAAVGCGGSDPYSGGPGEQAPSTSTALYPAGPYGAHVGDVLADATFFGYSSASDSNQGNGLVPISFHDVYDPDGTKTLADGVTPISAIYFSAGARWCPPCNDEASDFAAAGADWQTANGVALIQNLSEGLDQTSPFPADQDDLDHWLHDHAEPFPVFIDPAKRLNAYFDDGHIPFGMVIDPKSMKILKTTTGWFGGTTPKANLASLKQEIDDAFSAAGL